MANHYTDPNPENASPQELTKNIRSIGALTSRKTLLDTFNEYNAVFGPKMYRLITKVTARAHLGAAAVAAYDLLPDFPAALTVPQPEKGHYFGISLPGKLLLCSHSLHIFRQS